MFGVFLGVFLVFLGVFRVFLGVFLQVFLGVFRIFLGCSGFSWECSGFLGGVPGFSVVPECSVMFRCAGIPVYSVFRVPVFLDVLHAASALSAVYGPRAFALGASHLGHKSRRKKHGP